MESTTVELDCRHDAGIEVSLLWHRHTDQLVVIARDNRTGELLEIPVAHSHALRAFRHPYAYATSVGIDHQMPATTPRANPVD